jgi:hypothetical protein
MNFNDFPSPLGRRCREAAEEGKPYLNGIGVPMPGHPTDARGETEPPHLGPCPAFFEKAFKETTPN